jgi:hypothetical protein
MAEGLGPVGTREGVPSSLATLANARINAANPGETPRKMWCGDERRPV